MRNKENNTKIEENYNTKEDLRDMHNIEYLCGRPENRNPPKSKRITGGSISTH